MPLCPAFLVQICVKAISVITCQAPNPVQCAGQGVDECVVQAKRPWPIYHCPLKCPTDLRTEIVPGQVQGTVPLVLSGLSLLGGLLEWLAALVC